MRSLPPEPAPAAAPAQAVIQPKQDRWTPAAKARAGRKFLQTAQQAAEASAVTSPPRHPDAALFALKQIEEIISTRAVTTEGLIWKARLYRWGACDCGLAGSIIDDLLAMKSESAS